MFRGYQHETETTYEPHKLCDYIEENPVYIVSHDDVYNLAHFMNDAMSVWSMLVLSKNLQGKRSILLNIDGLNHIGASGGVPYRMMDTKDDDTLHQPFIDMYRTWFKEIRNIGYYKQKKVCFSELYIIPAPVVSWVWNGWRQPLDCSFIAPSSIYQSFNFYLRDQWEETLTRNKKYEILPKLRNTPSEIHILFAIRGEPNPEKSEGIFII